MWLNGNEVLELYKRRFDGKKFMWELNKVLWITCGLLFLTVSGMVINHVIRELNATYLLIYFPFGIVLGTLMGVAIQGILDSNQTKKVFKCLSIEEIESDFKERNYKMIFTSKISNIKINEHGDVYVYTPEGHIIFSKRDKVNAGDIGKKIVLTRTFFESEDVYLGMPRLRDFKGVNIS